MTNNVYPRAITPEGKLKTADHRKPGVTVIRYGASIGVGALILLNVTIGRLRRGITRACS